MGDVTKFRPRKPVEPTPFDDDGNVTLKRNTPPQLVLPEHGSPEISISAKLAAKLLRETADRLEDTQQDVAAVVVMVHFSDDDTAPMLVTPAYMSKIEVVHALGIMQNDILTGVLDDAVRPL